MSKKLIYIANWKTYFTYNQTLEFCQNHGHDLQKLTNNAHVVICPGFTALAQVKALLGSVSLGAQNCSAFELGAHTGDVDALSLKEVGVQYCIVGHSECRKNNHETPEAIAEKVVRLFEQGITPILCVSDEWANELEPVFKISHKTHLIIAYEPVGAIGTGSVPTNKAIEETVTNIQKEFHARAPEITISLVYGGSVSPESIQELKKIPLLDGFLIGKASTDFQKLKKIVE